MLPLTETLTIITIIMAAIGAIIVVYMKRTGNRTFKLGNAKIGPIGLFTLILCAPAGALIVVGATGNSTYLLTGILLFIFGIATYYIDLFRHRKAKNTKATGKAKKSKEVVRKRKKR
jgi:amino acid transporter